MTFFSLHICVLVIQQVPKVSEKLYILDSIDVPPSDLNKYRHLSVVNKLPDNIVLPPPPPLRHESSIPQELINNCSENAITEHIRQVKNDFETNNDGAKEDLVETRNVLVMQNVKKLLKKYRRQRDQMRYRPKAGNKSASQQNFHMQNEHNSDLSTPLRSLSPAHDFDAEMTTAVDLSINSKEIIDEFIENLSMCADDSGSGYDDLIGSPLAEIFLTETQPIPAGDDCVRDEKVQSETVDNLNELIETKQNEKDKEEVVAIEEVKEKEKEEELEKEAEAAEEEQIEKPVECIEEKGNSAEDRPLDVAFEVVPIDKLKHICINTLNTKEFRKFFTETCTNPSSEEEELSNNRPCTLDDSVIEKQIETCQTANLVEDSIVTSDSKNIECIPEHVDSPLPLSVPSLRQLVMPIIQMHQMQMSKNMKPLKLVLEFDSDKKPGDCDTSTDLSSNRVRALKELAREVANTIYSFNVKPLQDICKIALEKFNNLYVLSRMDESSNINKSVVSKSTDNLDIGKCMLKNENSIF